MVLEMKELYMSRAMFLNERIKEKQEKLNSKKMDTRKEVSQHYKELIQQNFYCKITTQTMCG